MSDWEKQVKIHVKYFIRGGIFMSMIYVCLLLLVRVIIPNTVRLFSTENVGYVVNLTQASIGWGVTTLLLLFLLCCVSVLLKGNVLRVFYDIFVIIIASLFLRINTVPVWQLIRIICQYT